MKKKWTQLVATAVAVALCIPGAGAAHVNSAGQTVIRVGLASSSPHSTQEELPSAHLENNTGNGAGYRFGYYDDSLNFVELGRTDPGVTKVAVLKTENLYYGYVSSLKKNTYSDLITSDLAVGCYHVLIGERSSWEEAQEEAAQYSGGFPAWINGGWQVRVGAYTSADQARNAIDQLGQGSVVGTSAYGMSVVRTGTNQVLFQFDMGEGGTLGILPDVTGAGDVHTWFSGYQYRGGFTYSRVTGGNLTVVNVLELEDYVKGVVCYEMGRLWPLEALKAQAVCARTYVLLHLNYHGARGFDVCNTQSCQAYHGVGTGSATYGPSEVSDRAVEETAGQVLYYNNSLAVTYYSSCHGGASEDAKNIWGTDTAVEYPYLRGVLDPYEQEVDDVNPSSSWTVSYTASQLTQRLQSYGYGTKTSLDHLELTYSALGNVIQVKLCYANGQSNTITPRNTPGIRSIFGLKSIRFTVNGKTVSSGASTGTGAAPGEYLLNGSDSLPSLDGLYVISGTGTTAQAGKGMYTISGSGSISSVEEDISGSTGSNEGGGTVSVSGSSYVFVGSGYGHQVGMSQFGANAMAKLGFDYGDILTHYFPGTNVGWYR